MSWREGEYKTFIQRSAKGLYIIKSGQSDRHEFFACCTEWDDDYKTAGTYRDPPIWSQEDKTRGSKREVYDLEPVILLRRQEYIFCQSWETSRGSASHDAAKCSNPILFRQRLPHSAPGGEYGWRRASLESNQLVKLGPMDWNYPER